MSQPNTIPSSYLSRCTEDLSSTKVFKLQAESVLLKVARGVTIIAYPLLLAGTVIITSIFINPIAGIALGVTLLLLNNRISSYVASGFDKLQSLGKECWKEANKCAAIQKQYADLSKRDLLQIQQDLSERGIDWKTIPTISVQQPETLKNLNPILAEAKYFDAEIEKNLTVRNKLVEEGHRLVEELDELDKKQDDHSKVIKNLLNRMPIDAKISQLGIKALNAEEKALNIKIQAAFANAVLRRGDYQGSLETIGSKTSLNLDARRNYRQNILKDLNSDAGDQPLFTFKNSNMDPLTHRDVKRLSIPELSRRFTAAISHRTYNTSSFYL